MKAKPILVDRVIRGRRAASRVRGRVRRWLGALSEYEVVPELAFVRVGSDPASAIYVRMKERACAKLGIRSRHVHLDDVRPKEGSARLMACVEALNDDPAVDGILVQLPLPEGFGLEVLERIAPEKDVDGFHPRNLGELFSARAGLEPCTPRGIMTMLRMLEVDLVGKRAVVIGRSRVVGRPAAIMLLRANATVTTCHRHTRDLERHVRQAEILVSAAGVAGLVPGAWLAEGAWVFDVGITRMADGSLRGDVGFDEALALGKVRGITPVPGGVGPMTVASLMENTVRAACLRRGYGDVLALD